METSKVYGVQRVYDDLRPSFVTKDVLKQLSQLDAAVEDVFARLQQKVTQEKNRVTAIDDRIRVCQAKVNAVMERRTSNKPTTVFSTSKYPAPKQLPPRKTLFHDKPYADAPIQVPEDDEDEHYLPAEALPAAKRKQQLNELLDLFEKVNMYRETTLAEVDMLEEGLGPLPEYVPSVGSVLLFNSEKNPYQKYTSWDNLLGTDYEEEEEKKKELAEAPGTLVHGDELPSPQDIQYKYRPEYQEHEGISAKLPTNLPLSDIAHETYTDESSNNASIAPSYYHDKTLPDLPTVSGFIQGPTALEPAQGDMQVGPTEEAPPAPPEVSLDLTQAHDVPPPPPPSDSVVEEDDDSVPPPPPPMSEMGDDDTDTPPPPPMPPANEQAEEEEDEAPADDGNPLNALLREIQKPKIQLRKVDPNEPQAAASSKAEEPSQPTTIADQLAERLRRRQAAQSGRQDILEQRREQERHRKPVQVVTAQEISESGEQSAPPPPPPVNDSNESKLPSVAMSDDGSDDSAFSDGSSGKSSVNEGNDLLSQIKNLRQKQEDEESVKPPPPTQPPKTEENTNPVANFETQMVGLRRDSDDSLDMSEASEWSD